MDDPSQVIKQLLMYTNDAVEATFLDGTKIFLAPCATEYVLQQGNHTKGLLKNKHRTVYTTSSLLSRIRPVLTFRNLYAQQPFLVPCLVDSTQCFQSSGTATHVRWSPRITLPTIADDDPSRTWRWSSVCGRALIEIPQCRQIVYITHPLQVSRIVASHSQQSNEIHPTKYVHIFAPVRRCFSCQQCPIYLRTFVNKCLQLIDDLSKANLPNIEHENKEEWSFELPSSLPSSSCPRAHRHRLHHEMMLEADVHVLQTAGIIYRLEYDNPSSIEALVMDENNQHLIDYIFTDDIQSSFYKYYSMKDEQCHLLTLSEHALPPQNERLIRIIRFMATMRESMLSMSRRVQEQPCWYQEESLFDESKMKNDNEKQLQKSSLYESDTDDENDIFRQTSIVGIGHFKYFLNERVRIEFSNGFILEMTPEQVHACQKNPFVDVKCRITDKRKQTTIDIFDGASQSSCYAQFVSAAVDWCMWVWNEHRAEHQRHLRQSIEQELFRLKLYSNMNELKQTIVNTVAASSSTTTVTKNDYYSPEEIKQLLERTAQFTRTHSS